MPCQSVTITIVCTRATVTRGICRHPEPAGKPPAANHSRVLQWCGREASRRSWWSTQLLQAHALSARQGQGCNRLARLQYAASCLCVCQLGQGMCEVVAAGPQPVSGKPCLRCQT
jgi:hypothetical protein